MLLGWCFALQEKAIAASRLFSKRSDSSHQRVSVVHRSLFSRSLTLSSFGPYIHCIQSHFLILSSVIFLCCRTQIIPIFDVLGALPSFQSNLSKSEHLSRLSLRSFLHEAFSDLCLTFLNLCSLILIMFIGLKVSCVLVFSLQPYCENSGENAHLYTSIAFSVTGPDLVHILSNDNFWIGYGYSGESPECHGPFCPWAFVCCWECSLPPPHLVQSLMIWWSFLLTTTLSLFHCWRFF